MTSWRRVQKVAPPEKRSSDKPRSASERSGNSEKKNHSSSHTFIVSQQATKRFVADDLLTFGKRIINCGPIPSKRSVVQSLMRPHRVVINFVRRDEIIEVPLTEDDEEIQALEFYRFYPSLDKCVLIWRLWSRLLHSTTNVLKHLIEFLDIHAIAITDEILDPKVNFPGLLNKDMSLVNHPFCIGLEAAGRADHSSSAKMNKRQHKGLPQASRRPDHLTEEVNLPERVDVEFEELIPSATAALGARPNSFFFEDVCNGRLADGMNPQFLQFSKRCGRNPSPFVEPGKR